ncbi:hypothetical protein LLH23_14315 [bacterium]|nr:hypothetical protein [bacterium]
MRSSALFMILLAAPLCAAENPIPNPSFEEVGQDGWAVKWGRYNWGPEGSQGSQKIDTTVAHTGRNSLQGINETATARGGGYTHVPLAKGTWALSFWAKSEPGKSGLACCYLATAYSRAFRITDQWQKFTFRNTLFDSVDRAEINVQNASGAIGTIWFDDIALEPCQEARASIVPDKRPARQQPRLLYFSTHLMSWADEAEKWHARGFSGAFIDNVYSDIWSDVWAVDKDPNTRGEDDKLLQECRAANARCLKAGVDANVLKVAFYTDLPDPFDDAGYARITANFREAARFARLAKFPCFAVDTEYTAYQFDPAWKGYGGRHTPAELATKTQERWATIFESVIREYPQVELLTLPEGSIHYGPLWASIFAGMIEGMERTHYTRGIHQLTESTYQMRAPWALRDFAESVRDATTEKLPARERTYWRKYGDLALGCWPLGYYRAITDNDGKFLGWSGKKETYGDKITGSYADKSENYPLAEFGPQFAAARSFSGKYCWIYGHGTSWMQYTPEQVEHYKQVSMSSFPAANWILPTVSNIAEYYHITATPQLVKLVEQ